MIWVYRAPGLLKMYVAMNSTLVILDTLHEILELGQIEVADSTFDLLAISKIDNCRHGLDLMFIGDITMSIDIDLIERTLQVQAGAGIVADSQPE